MNPDDGIGTPCFRQPTPISTSRSIIDRITSASFPNVASLPRNHASTRAARSGPYPTQTNPQAHARKHRVALGSGRRPKIYSPRRARAWPHEDKAANGHAHVEA